MFKEERRVRHTFYSESQCVVKKGMNKTELINAMSEKTGLSKSHAEKALNAFTETVAEALTKGDKVQLIGFGTFEVAERAARQGRNPQTGETIEISAVKLPKFKAGKSLKNFCN